MPDGPLALPPTDIAPLGTPEGYPILIKLNGSAYDVFIQISSSTTAKYVKFSNAASDYSTSNRTQFPFLTNHQEAYDGRAALTLDPDFDGVVTAAELACGLNPNNADSDGDLLSDSQEDANGNGVQDRLADGAILETDPLSTDSDIDGLWDGPTVGTHVGEAAVGTGAKDADSDDDGLRDGQEIAGWKVGIWWERTMEKTRN